MAENIQRIDNLSWVVDPAMDINNTSPGVKQLETGEMDNKTNALDKLLEQFSEYITFWHDSGFNITDFKGVFDRFYKSYEEWKKKKEGSSLSELAGDKLKKIYDEFFIVRNKVDRSLLLLEEVEELYAIDTKVPKAKIVEIIKILKDKADVEKRMKVLKELVYKRNKITPEDVRKRALEYVQTIKEEVQELKEKGDDIGRALVHLHKAKQFFSERKLEKAMNMCRLVRVEIKYIEGLRAISSKKKRAKRIMKKKKVITKKKKSAQDNLLRKCVEILRSAKESISKLHGSGKDVGDLLRIYMKAKPALKKKDYQIALDLGMEVNDIAQGMLAPPPSEEQLLTSRYCAPDEGFDFEIVAERYTPLVKEEIKGTEERFMIEFECSECGVYVPEGAQVCPSCGEVFKEIEPLPAGEERPVPGVTEIKEEEFYIPTTGKAEVGDIEEIEEIEEIGEIGEIEEIDPISKREQLKEVGVMRAARGPVIVPDTGSIAEEMPMEGKDTESAAEFEKHRSTDWRERVEPEAWVEERMEAAVKKSPPEDQITRLIEIKQKEAEELANEGRLHEALDLLNTVLNIKPGHPPALNDKGTILFTLGEMEKALVMYDMALESDPKIIDTWTNKGFALHHMGNLTGAFYSYERALALNPNNTEVLSSIGALYFEIDKYDKAMKYFERATGIKPNDPDLWYFRGFTNEVLERWHAALTCYNEVLRLKPFHEEALFGRDKCKEKLRMETEIHRRDEDYERCFFRGFYN